MRKITLFFFILWPIIVAWLSFSLSFNAITSLIFFYIIPSVILSAYMPQRIKKSLFVSTFILPLIIIGDCIAEYTGSWFYAPSFPFKLSNFITSIDALLWGFFHVYFVIMFYQYFFEKSYFKKIWDEKSKEALVGTIGIFTIFLLALIIYPAILNIPYWYLAFGILGFLPIVIFEDFRYPMVFPKLLKTGIFFFYLNFVYEIVGLKLNWWSFPGKQFIGYISLFGETFPFEELFFFLIFFTLAILSAYEYFFNRER
jgi:hypothetical protein